MKKFFSILIFWNTLLFADMQIDITRGTDLAHPIAIIPFKYINQNDWNILDANNIQENIESIITVDLRNSGKFNTLPISYLPNYPHKLDDIIPNFWKKLDIHTILLGSVNVNDKGQYIISYQLIDASNNPALIILENQYVTDPKWLRYIAHTISDDIFKKLTGISGIFCTRIAYVVHTQNTKYPYELYISDYDGNNPNIICRSKEPLMSPAWSPDGEKIAYVTFSSGQSELVIQMLNTGVIHSIINFPQHNGAPAFSPDGKKIAFSLSKTGSLNLYIKDLNSEKIQQLTNNNNNNTEPSWFPDSQSLAYTSDQSGTPQIYKINLITHNITRLSWNKTNNQKPCVSSDGSFLIMINRYQGKQNVIKLNLKTGLEQNLTNSFFNDTPSISPNDNMLVYSTVKNLKSVLELVSIDGKFRTELKDLSGNIRFPIWSPYFKNINYYYK